MKWEDQKLIMVEKQLFERGIKNENILKAFLKVDRHKYIPQGQQTVHSYEDCALPIGENQTISQPYIVAYMINALGVDKNLEVLEIGTGSGYQTAILAELAKTVYSVERVNKLYIHAKKLIESQYNNVYFRVGDGTKGWEKAYPVVKEFDRIIVSAGSPKNIPDALLNQLKPNGRMVIPAGGLDYQSLTLVTKNENGEVTKQVLGQCTFVPLIGQQGWK